MLRPNLLRGAAYAGVLALLAGAFAWAKARASRVDPGLLLSAVHMQLRLASSMPKLDQHQQPVVARQQLLAEAAANLAQLEAQVPGMTVVLEFRGYWHGLRDEALAAASSYRAAHHASDVQPDQRAWLQWQECRMWAAGGDLVAAAAAGRALLADNPRAMVDSVLESNLPNCPLAGYYLARLKLWDGAVDTAMALLETAVAALPGETRCLLLADASDWRCSADDPRFQKLLTTSHAAPCR